MTERPSFPVLDRSRCTACGDCVPACPPAVLALVRRRLQFVNPAACDYCGECEAICREDAISCPYEIVLESESPGQ